LVECAPGKGKPSMIGWSRSAASAAGARSCCSRFR
jgi:hypothetical protein